MEQRLDRIAVHWHDFYELAFVVDGRATHVVNGAAEQIGAGSVIMLTPADFHEFESHGPAPLVCLNVVIDAAVVERDLADLLPAATAWFPATVDGCEDLEPDFGRLLRESDSAGLGTAAATRGALRCIMIELARRVESAPARRTRRRGCRRRSAPRDRLRRPAFPRAAHASPRSPPRPTCRRTTSASGSRPRSV